jgi:hypothetical protein
MFVQPHQFEHIAVPKKACQRGLEEYVVASHPGDKQTSSEKTPYLYLNNPIYRVGPEGDPAPGSLSSRQFQAILKPTQSQLHSLHPTIDSGTVFLPEVPWDNRWTYQRDNIPNNTGNSHQYSPHQLNADAMDNTFQLDDYDWFVGKTLHDWDEKEKMTRYLPIYDQAGINDKLVPDGVHVEPYYQPPMFKPPPFSGNNLPPRTILTENFQKEHGKMNVEKKGEKKRENYINMRDRDSVRSKLRPNFNGYPKPTNYATIGQTDDIYYVSPYPELSNFSRTGGDIEKTDGVAGVYANRVDRSGVNVYENLSNSFKLGNPDLIREPATRFLVTSIDDKRNDHSHTTENFQIIDLGKPQSYKLCMILAVILLIVVFICLAYYLKRKNYRKK